MRARASSFALFRWLIVAVLASAFALTASAQIVNMPGATPVPRGVEGALGDIPDWTIDSVAGFGCNNGNIALNTTFSGLDGIGPYNQETIAVAGGLTYMHQLGNFVDADGPALWGIFADSSGGPTDGTFPIPPDTNIFLTFILYDPSGTPLCRIDATMDACNTGNLISNVGCLRPPASAPAMSPWSLALLAGLLAGFGWLTFMRRRRAS